MPPMFYPSFFMGSRTPNGRMHTPSELLVYNGVAVSGLNSLLDIDGRIGGINFSRQTCSLSLSLSLYPMHVFKILHVFWGIRDYPYPPFLKTRHLSVVLQGLIFQFNKTFDLERLRSDVDNSLQFQDDSLTYTSKSLQSIGVNRLHKHS